jgi:cytoskeleton protein RodZ
LSLDQAAQQLKLAPRQVQALEDEDFAQLPGRTFARGFVRNYARLLNLDADGLLAIMPDATQAPALEAPALQATGAMIAELPVSERSAPNVARWLIPLVLIACVVAAASYEWYRGRLAPAGESALPRTAKVEPTVDTARSAAVSSKPLPNPLTEGTKQEPVAAPEPQASESSSTPAPSAPVSASSTPAVVPGAASSAASEPATAPSAPQAPAGSVALQLSYRGPSWTEIRDRDGQVLILRLVPAGSEQALSGTPPFEVVIGNAAAVRLVYRGVAVDLAPFTRGNVARLRLS